MFAFAPIVALALAISASAYSVSTPEKLELCKEAQYVIKDASPTDHYTAYFVHGDNPCGDEIFHLEVTGSEFKWKVNVTGNIMVALDNGSDEQWSGALTVQGTDDSCITATPESPARASASSSSSSSSSSTRASGATAPVNAASSAPSASDVPNGGTTRAIFGISSALALVGAAMVGVSL